MIKRRVISGIVSIAMVITMFNAVALAAPEEGVSTEGSKTICQVCGHEHDTECGYKEAVEGKPCNHIHNEECGYTDSEDGTTCNHQHDEECGYVEAVEEQPCNHQCEETKSRTVAKNGTEYTVSTADDFSAAIAAIKASTDSEATIVFVADNIDVNTFSGIAGKHITLKSSEGNAFQLDGMGTDLVGDLTLANVKVYNSYSIIYANGHLFETLDGFSGINGATIRMLFGGGKKGADVAGNTTVKLSSGNFSDVYGGGQDSKVSGDTYMLVDGSQVHLGGLYGGGYAKDTASGTVEGNATIDFKQGTNGMLFGGGMNAYSKDNRDAAKVSGTVTVTLGYKGAPAGTVNTGTAMYTYGGSWNSTVGNVVLKLLEGSTNVSTGGDRNYFGCGYRDTVLGTVQIVVDGSDLRSDGHIYGGGGQDSSMNDSYGPVKVLNENESTNAVTIQYSSPSDNTDGGLNAGSDDYVPMTIQGNVLVEMDEGNLAFCVLDNENQGNCTISGTSEILIKGGRIAQIEGNTTNPENSSVIYNGCGTTENPQQSGYLNRFSSVLLKNNAQVEINIHNFSQFTSVMKPFYNVKGLEVQTRSNLTTVAGQSWIYGDVKVDGTWEQKFVGNKDYNDLFVQGSLTSNGGTLISHGTTNIKGNTTVTDGKLVFCNPAYIQGIWQTNNTEVRLPVMETDTNYPGTAIPLWVKGAVTGNAKVYTMDANDWTKNVKPVVGENYIVALREGSEKTFKLANDDAITDGLYFKKLVDANANTPQNDMWQVAKGYTVTYDANGGSGIMTDGNAPYEPKDTVTILENTFTNENKEFIGWNTQADGKGTSYKTNDTFQMPASNVTLYAQWKFNSGGNEGGGTEDGTEGGTGGHTGHTTTNEKTESNTIGPDKVPETGDTTGAGFWLMLSIISGLGLIWVNTIKRQRNI